MQAITSDLVNRRWAATLKTCRFSLRAAHPQKHKPALHELQRRRLHRLLLRRHHRLPRQRREQGRGQPLHGVPGGALLPDAEVSVAQAAQRLAQQRQPERGRVHVRCGHAALGPV